MTNIILLPFHDAYKIKLSGLRSCLCIMPISKWGYEQTSSVTLCMLPIIDTRELSHD